MLESGDARSLKEIAVVRKNSYSCQYQAIFVM
jgi:hypothetical protein